MPELTDEQKEEAQKVMAKLVDHLWKKIKVKMDTEGMGFNEALFQIMEEIQNA